LLYKTEDSYIEPLSELTRRQIINFIGVHAKKHSTLPAELQKVSKSKVKISKTKEPNRTVVDIEETFKYCDN